MNIDGWPTKATEHTLFGTSLFATGGLVDLGGGDAAGENACATRPTLNPVAWLLLLAAAVEFPDPVGPLLNPAVSRRDAAAGFFIIACCAAAAAVAFPEDPAGLLLACFNPATSRRDASAGFFIIARCATAVMAPQGG